MVTHLHEKFYRSNATQLSEADIKEIRESRSKIPNATKKMANKFHIGPKCVYEIQDNKERLQQEVISFSSGQPILNENSQTNKIEQTESDIHSQNTFPSTKLEKKIYNVEVEPSESTDSASEGSVILGGKTKKTGGKKSKSKSALAELIPSPVQTQPISTSDEKIAERNIKNIANMKNILEK